MARPPVSYVRPEQTGISSQVVVSGSRVDVYGGENVVLARRGRRESVSGRLRRDALSESVTIKKSSDLTVGGSRQVTVKGSYTGTYGSTRLTYAGLTERVTGDRSTLVGGPWSVAVGGDHSVVSSGAIVRNAAGPIQLLAANIPAGGAPSINGLDLQAMLGNVKINAMAGLIQLGGLGAIHPSVLGDVKFAADQALADALIAAAPAFTLTPTSIGLQPGNAAAHLIASLVAWVAASGAAVNPYILQSNFPSP